MNAPSNVILNPVRARLRVEDFVLLAESRAFADYTKTELIDGDIYVMNAQWSEHARAKSRLMVALAIKLAGMGCDLEAMSEVSVRIADDSMPEPDIVLTRWRGRGAVPSDSIALIVEIAHTTLEIDLGRKSQLYAVAGVPEYWVVDLNGDRVMIHDGPGPDGYRERLEVTIGQPLHAATIPGLTVESAMLIA